MKAKDIAIALFAILLLAIGAFVWLTPSGVSQAPELQVTTLDGAKVNIHQFRGRPLLVVFWATTCPGCIEEMPHLVELYQELAPKGLSILAIAMEYDPPQQVRELVRRKGLPYMVALDADGSAARAFGEVKLTPTTFLIDSQGRIVQQKLGALDMAVLRQRIALMLRLKA